MPTHSIYGISWKSLPRRNRMATISAQSFSFQAQPKQAENKETFARLKKRLIDSGIPEEEIAIKTAEINELKNVKLQSPDCKIKYIITVNALKEGWDCPFAYLLATLANKTSAVDVEQILGRVLRLPYTQKNSCKFLNLSYVLTCSNDFHTTITKIIQGLNDAGFSDNEYRIAEDKTDLPPAPVVTQQEMPLEEKEENAPFDESALKKIIEQRQITDNVPSVTAMLSSAESNSDAYDAAMQQAETEPAGDLPLEVRNMATTYPMYEQFKDEAHALKIPQFFIEGKPSLFTWNDPEHKDLLTKEELSDGFTLKAKDTEIDFASATEDVVEIDVQKNERPKYHRLEEKDSESFKEMLQSLPPASRVKNCKILLKRELERLDSVSGSDLTAYIERIVGNMDGDELAAMEKNIFRYAAKIKAKIESLLDEYRKQRFYHLIETGKIQCLPSFQLKREINPGNPYGELAKSLYKSEQAVNEFERKVIEKVSALPNVRWWHRNMDRIEFCINGYLNHYPDFMVMTEGGKVVMIETKGSHLTSNDDSRMKAELGKIWQAQAGSRYRYYMVSSEPVASNPDAISLDEFLKIMREL